VVEAETEEQPPDADADEAGDRLQGWLRSGAIIFDPGAEEGLVEPVPLNRKMSNEPATATPTRSNG